MSIGEVRVSVFGKTDLGRTRDHNEDTFLVADLSARRAALTPDVRDHRVGERGSLFMVADGMGGAAAGEVASAMAADAIYTHLTTAWIEDGDTTPHRFAFRMKEAVEVANQRIHQYAVDHPEVRGMGTTVTAAGLMSDELFLAQIGDSRAYLVRGEHAVQITKDQSLMQRLIDAGELTEEEAEQSERRNIILQALGPDVRVKVDLTVQRLRRGDRLVLCSDGLSGLVKRDEIAQLVLQNGHDLGAACTALIDLANSRGGPDNVTVVVAYFDGDGLQVADPTDPVGHQSFLVDEDDIPTAEHPIITTTEQPTLPPTRVAAAVGAARAEVAVAAPAAPETGPRAALIVAALLVLGAVALLFLL